MYLIRKSVAYEVATIKKTDISVGKLSQTTRHLFTFILIKQLWYNEQRKDWTVLWGYVAISLRGQINVRYLKCIMWKNFMYYWWNIGGRCDLMLIDVICQAKRRLPMQPKPNFAFKIALSFERKKNFYIKCWGVRKINMYLIFLTDMNYGTFGW